MITFGGFDEEQDRMGRLRQYKRQSDKWTGSGAPGPAARTGHVAVWDDSSDSMLMCCGISDVATLHDLWSFDGDSWTELFPSGSIVARAFSSAVWDPTAQVMLGFGGQESSYLSSLYQQQGCM